MKIQSSNTLISNRSEPKPDPSLPAGWDIAFDAITGSHHLVTDTPCQDKIAFRLALNGLICIALADGVSGGALGEVASQATVQFCIKQTISHAPGTPDPTGSGVRQREHLLDALDAAVVAAVAKYTDRIGAATFSAAWTFPDGQAWVTRIGDCRVYHHHQGGLRRVAEDQTYASLPLDRCPPNMPLDNPSNMVGNGTMGPAHFYPLMLAHGDSLLLCTDGLHHFVDDAAIAAQFGLLNGDALVRALITQALAAGGNDDIAILVLTRRVAIALDTHRED